MKFRQYRKTLNVLVSAGVLAAAFGCTATRDANERTYTIAFAYFGPDPGADNVMAGFLSALQTEGFVEGKNLEVKKQHAFGELANLTPIMQSLESQRLDLIVPMTTPGVAAAATAVRRSRAVFCFSYDPLGAGAGKSLTEHLPNMTGVASFPPVADTMKTIQHIFPKTKTIGTLYNASEANSVRAVREARGVLANTGVTLQEVTVSATNEVLQGAQALMARGIDVFWVTGDNTVTQALEGPIKVALDSRKPLILNDPEFVERGALMAVGIAWRTTGIAAGKMAARVLRGEDPQGIPIVNVAEQKTVINKEVAQKLGINFPPDILAEAER
jgi:ABC-type uncharacterized transport system substrate-binding protein